MPDECIVYGHLRCSAKTKIVRRGVHYVQISLARSSGYTVKYTVPESEAEAIGIGQYYRVAILRDTVPEEKQVRPRATFNPGDHVVESWTWSNTRVWVPAVFLGLTPGGGQGVIRSWSRGESEERRARFTRLAPATQPFPTQRTLGRSLLVKNCSGGIGW